MRVSITGEKLLMKALLEEIEQDQQSKVERVEEARDSSELGFVLGEAVTIVSLVNGVIQLTSTGS